MKILVGEKCGEFRKILTIGLQMLGHEIESSAHLTAIAAHLERVEFDLVLLDLSLGEEEAVSELVRTWSEKARICLMNQELRSDKLASLQESIPNVFDSLAKPFALDKLNQVLARCESETQACDSVSLA